MARTLQRWGVCCAMDPRDKPEDDTWASPSSNNDESTSLCGFALFSPMLLRPPFSIAAILALALVAAGTGGVGVVTPAEAQGPALTKEQSAAVAAYDKALSEFKAVLGQRRRQIDAKQKLPNLPGQAIYLARLKVMSTYKDLTDALPSRIGRANKFGVPPAYFEADIEPLIEEYAALFRVMQAPPANAQASETPFKDVADLASAIARAKGLDTATVDAA